ncbi:MAG: rhomboid family intramembrane serine protease [Tenericutes bacterium]|nr:rhomboid family intramembrane serine protease [Mycoplasmatota bacterium]
MNIKINKKDDVILKILHYFITEEDYKPVIINGLENEIWLENMENDLKLIRINTNYIHNEEQFKSDIFKVKTIMKSIKRNTLSLKMTTLNLLLDTGENVNIIDNKNIETIKVGDLEDFKKNKVVKEFFPKVSDTTLTDEVDPVEFFKLTEDMNQKTIKNEKKLAKIFSPKKPIVTYIIIVLNLMVFLYGMLHSNDELINIFGNNYELVQKGQFYRLLTCMFVHGSIMHLLLNMYALYTIGPVVERYYGKSKYIFIYLVSGLLGSVFSSVFMSAGSISIGASGAIFGLLGSICYFTYYYRATLQGILRESIVPVIVINLIIGFMLPSVDLVAHIGGLLGGILVSMGLGIGDKYRKNDQINGFIVLILMFIFLIYMIMTK